MQLENRQPEEIPPVVETPKQNTGLWGGWPTFGLGLAILAIYLFAQTLVTIVFLIRRLISDSGQINTESILKLATNGNLLSIVTLVSTILGTGFIILFIKIHKGASIRDYLGLKSISKKTFLVLLAIIIGLFALSYVLDLVLQIPQDTGFTVDALKTTSCPVLLWISVVVLAPLFEESFFRGFVFVGLKQTRIGAIGTIALTSAVWAMLHIQYNIYGMGTILVLGIVFGIVRLKTGSLWSTLFLHSIWNTIAMVSTTLYINGVIR